MRGAFAVGLLTLLAVFPAAAWEHVIPGGEANAVLLADDGDVVTAGLLGDASVELWELAVVRLSGSHGSERWRYVISSEGPLYQRGVYLAPAPGGTFVVAAHQRERYQEFTGTVAKLSGDGAELWRFVPAQFIGFYAVAVDPAGDVIAAGAISVADPADHDLVVVKLSGDTGTELWRRVIPGVADDVFEHANAVAVDSVGDVFAGGEFFARAEFGWPDFFVVKLASASGAEVWRGTVPSVSGHGGQAYDLAIDANDDLVAAGSAVPGGGWCDFVVAKFRGADGTRLWQSAIDEGGNCDDAQAIAIDTAGDVIATGDIGNKFSTVKFVGATGALLWRYDVLHLSECSGGGCASGRAIRADSSGNALVAGNARGVTTSEMTSVFLDRDSGEPIWLQRLDFAQCDDLGFSADINVEGDVAIGGLAYSQTGGVCTWPQGGRFSVVKLFGDVDGDAIANDLDNCRLESNPGQIDSNRDGYGNACDADYNDDGFVGLVDFLRLRKGFGATTDSPSWDPAVDSNADGVIGSWDFARLRASFGALPGPSALSCTGIVPCP